MSPKLEIGSALEYGFDRVLTRGGAILLSAYIVLQLTSQIGFQSLFGQLLAGTIPAGRASEVYPLAVGLSAPASAILTLLLLVVTLVFTVVMLRALYADIDDVPSEEHTRDLARTAVVTVVVSVIVSVAVGIGFVLLVIPGIFLGVSLVFAQAAVVIEDAGVVEALKRSWSLTSGNRIRLFALGLLLVVAGAVVGGVGTALGVAAPTVGNVLSYVLSSVVSFYGFAVLVGAYRQLAGDEDGVEEAPHADDPVTV